MLRGLHTLISRIATPVSILLVAASFVVLNGGIAIGSGNHVGLIPVVRRLLDPQYLPGDFNIEIRLYHHRLFAWVLAQLSAAIGEDWAFVAVHVVSVVALSAALFYLCRAVGLGALEYLIVGLLLSVNAFGIGLGLEENNFVGNQEVQPTTLAHASVLAGTAAIIQSRWRLTAFFVALATLSHLQIGFIFGLLVAPFYASRVWQFGWKELLAIAFSFLIPAAPAFWQAGRILQRGLESDAFTIEYLKFRMPHHFELISIAAGIWLVAHIVVMLAAFVWLRRRNHEATRGVVVLLTISLTLVGLVLVHFLDYNWLHTMTTLKIQFPRLTPMLTVFGGIVVVKWITIWRLEHPNRWRPRFALPLLILVGLVLGLGQIKQNPERFQFGVERYADQKSDWVEMCNWIKEHGPSASVFLAPPGRYGFTTLTNRSSVVEFKINPDGGQYLELWTERLRDFCGGKLPEGQGLENRRLIDRAFARLSASQLLALGQKYNANYAVLPQSSPAILRVLHQNEDYRLVELRVH